jgi:DivIVA domain-containing protein
MALTPEDVVSKRFTTTKFRDGYDQDEVDDFLDEVVEEMRRLTKENEEMRSGGAVPVPVSEYQPPKLDVSGSNDESPEESSHNLLALARKLHEQHVSEGVAKRDELVQEGQETANRLVREAENSVRQELAKLETEKSAVENEIRELKDFETRYRRELREYIEAQLSTLDVNKAQQSDNADEE